MERDYKDFAPGFCNRKGKFMEEKKPRYTPSQKKASEKYLHEKVEDIRIRVPKGQKQVVKDHADTMGESLNAFVIRAISETISRDKPQ